MRDNVNIFWGKHFWKPRQNISITRCETSWTFLEENISESWGKTSWYNGTRHQSFSTKQMRGRNTPSIHVLNQKINEKIHFFSFTQLLAQFTVFRHASINSRDFPDFLSQWQTDWFLLFGFTFLINYFSPRTLDPRSDPTQIQSLSVIIIDKYM